MDKQLVSIIIPVFNAETTLDRCLQSILQQTYKKIEIIIINDGSTDRSSEICEKYAQRERCVCVIHQKNTGPATARNRGIERATGSFIQFVDADDLIEPTMTATLVKLMSKADFVICGYTTEEKQRIPHLQGNQTKKICVQQLGRLYEEIIFPSPCNKLYRTAIIRDYQLSFLDGCFFGEDLRFNLAYLAHCRKIFFNQQVLYHYENNTTSISRGYIPRLFQQYLALHEEVQHFLKEYNGQTVENSRIMASIFSKSIVQAASNIFHHESPYSWKEKKHQLTDIMTHPIVIETVPTWTGQIQTTLFKYLVQAQAIRAAAVFFHGKEQIRQRYRNLFNILKTWNR